MERNLCVDTYSGSLPQCVAFIHIIVTGVVDVQLMSVEDHHRVLAVAEIKSSGEGIYQLLVALYRTEMSQRIFPVGKLAFSSRKRKLFQIVTYLSLGVLNTISNLDLTSFHGNKLL